MTPLRLFLAGLVPATLLSLHAAAQTAPSAAAALAAPATTTAPAAPPVGAPPALQISDIPKHTQIGAEGQGINGNARMNPPVPPKNDLPTLWLIGDSTVRNGSFGDGSNMDQWGWGAPLVAFFDPAKINVVNRAWGGTGARSFYSNSNHWPNMLPLIKKGDFLIMQFGANGAQGVSGLQGSGDQTQETGGQTVHTFGWYLEQMAKEAREKGATAVFICSLTPRKVWRPDGTFVRASADHAAWSKESAQKINATFIDLQELIARRYEQVGREQVDLYYVPSPGERLHPGWNGAVVNAECVVAGLKALKDNPLAPYFSDRAKYVVAVDVAQPAPPVKPPAPAAAPATAAPAATSATTPAPATAAPPATSAP